MTSTRPTPTPARLDPAGAAPGPVSGAAPGPVSDPVSDPGPTRRRLTAWPLVGAGTGVLGIVATLITDLHPMDWAARTATPAVLDDVSRTAAQASLATGFLAVLGLVVLAASWRRHVEPRASGSTAARMVPLGLVTAAGALTLGYGYKGMLAIYLPGGINADAFDTQALYTMYVLNDFGSFVGWFGVTLSAGAVAWMSLRERTVSRWIGVVSVLPVLAVAGMAIGTGLPGFPGVVMPLWLVIAGTGLAVGRSPITR